MKYIKLYTSVKDGIGSKDQFGQLINPKYLDDVLNFVTNFALLTRKVRVNLGNDFLNMREVQVFNFAGENVALGKPASQSSTYKDDNGDYSAKNAVNGIIISNDFSSTNNDISEYHIS
jgi:hypothetical protein